MNDSTFTTHPEIHSQSQELTTDFHFSVKVCIENLSHRNPCRWIELPKESEDLKAMIGTHRTMIIEDDAHFPIYEFTNLLALNEHLIRLNQLMEIHYLDSNQVEALLDDQHGDFGHVISIIESERYIFYPVTSKEELGEYYIHELCNIPYPENPHIVYDYERTGESLACSGIVMTNDFAYETW